MEMEPEENGCFEMFARLIFSLVLLITALIILF
jgi:hypothetical protein